MQFVRGSSGASFWEYSGTFKATGQKHRRGTPGLQQEEGRADQIQLRVWAAYRVTYDSLQYTPFYKL